MIDSVLVSEEIESLVDKENLFGHESGQMIPATLYFKDANLLAALRCFVEKDERTELELKIESSPLAILILQKKIEKIVIGSMDSHCIVLNDLAIESTSLIAEEDMYICKIIMDN